MGGGGVGVDLDWDGGLNGPATHVRYRGASDLMWSSFCSSSIGRPKFRYVLARKDSERWISYILELCSTYLKTGRMRTWEDQAMSRCRTKISGRVVVVGGGACDSRVNNSNLYRLPLSTTANTTLISSHVLFVASKSIRDEERLRGYFFRVHGWAWDNLRVFTY